MSEFAQLRVMSPFVVNGETKRRSMTEVIIINEKHVAPCLLAKSPLCSTAIRKTQKKTKSEIDATEFWSMRYFSWTAWMWDERRRRELLKALMNGNKVVDVSCMTG